MNKYISLNGGDWLLKEFYGEDWRWQDSHMPDSRDLRGWEPVECAFGMRSSRARHLAYR